MFGWLTKLFGFGKLVWEASPDHIKEKIIDIVVETFDAIFRAYFQNFKNNQEPGHE